MAIKFIAKSKLPTAFGNFEIIAFQDQNTGGRTHCLSQRARECSYKTCISQNSFRVLDR